MKTSVLLSIATAFILNLNMANAEESMVTPGHSEIPAEKMTMVDVLYTEEEAMKEISDWMLNPVAFETEMEMIEIESWMLDESLFSQQEDMIEVEDWMLDPNGFVTTSDNREEPFREIEDWMFSF
jgi:hypothetical protein